MDMDDVVPIMKQKSYSEKSKAQQSKDRVKVCDSGTPNAVISAAAKVFYDRGQKEASYVVKELQKNPEETGNFIN